ncbi:GTPase RhebL1 [Pluvialis apricaria]
MPNQPNTECLAAGAPITPGPGLLEPAWEGSFPGDTQSDSFPCPRGDAGTAAPSSALPAPPPPAGKTSLAHQFLEGKFVECYEPTVPRSAGRGGKLPARAYKKMVVVGKEEFQLQLVDTAGQDEYTILPHSFITGIHGYVLVYSVTSLRSFQVVKTLHNKLYESWGKTGGRPGRCCPSWGGEGPGRGAGPGPHPPHARSMPVVLVGNKADLSLQSQEVKTDEGKKLVESWGAIFLESSAKENQVTQGIFMKIIEEIDQVDNSYGRSTGCRLM